MQVLLDYIYELNWVAVVVAACIGMLINAVWYSDYLFGKVWMKSAGLKKKDLEKDGVDVALIISFMTIIVTAAALGVLTMVLKLDSAVSGAFLGGLVGFAFLAMNNGMHKLYEQRPFALFAVTAVGDILTMTAIGAILAVW
jgi:hypothetical protein